jgi:hypothetical protein
MAIMLFMAITSTGSAEGIAVSSLVAYDIYKTYINPAADGAKILLVSKVVIVIFGGSMGLLSVLLHAIGLNLGWVYQFMGTAIGSAVVPLWNMLMWKDANAVGAVVGCWGGQIAALIVWIIATSIQFEGEVTVDNLGALEPNLAGNLVAICLSGIIHTVFSLAKPQNYDFKSMGEIKMLEDDKRGLDEDDFTDEKLTEAKMWVQKWGWSFTITMVVIWPILSIPAGVFTKGYWAMWVFLSIAWSFVATFVIIWLPIYESADAFTNVFRQMAGMAAKEEKASVTA